MSTKPIALARNLRLLIVILASALLGANWERPERPRIHLLFFAEADLDSRYAEMAVFWFGRVDPRSNSVDVRAGWGREELFVGLAIIDRLLWYDPRARAEELTHWDAVSLNIHPPGGPLHRFVGMLHEAEVPSARARSGGKGPTHEGFRAVPGWWGEKLNDATEDRGWALTFRLPWATLVRRPREGEVWRVGLVVHDRDSPDQPSGPDQVWPQGFDPDRTQTRGEFVFGQSKWRPPPHREVQEFLIRHGHQRQRVVDQAVGGGSVCGDGLDFWTEWGDSTREAGAPDVNIQNQSDIANWPCFSRYFVTFPLDSLPKDLVVVQATLVLHQFGNSEPSEARPSWIQVLEVKGYWEEGRLSWNTAPPVWQNWGGAWVGVLARFPGWPGVPRHWDVSRAVAQAHARPRLLRLVL